MDATLNVRMSAPVKERGDRVLREHGVSASMAVRALWQELAATRELPDFLQRAAQDSAKKKARMLALEELSGVAEGALSALSDEEIEALGMARYEDDAL